MTGILISVVIPTLDEAGNIVAAIASARRDYPPGEVEIVVADGGSTDGTPDVLPDGVRMVTCARGRALQMNRGAAAARGRVLLFLHADTRLPSRWREAVLKALAGRGIVGGSFRPVFAPGRGVLRLLNLVARLPWWPGVWWLTYGDQAMFMHHATFERVGGFPEQPLMEDLELARALHREGTLVRLRLPAVTSSRRFLEWGPMRQQTRNSWLVLRYLALGATAEEVARDYVPRRAGA